MCVLCINKDIVKDVLRCMPNLGGTGTLTLGGLDGCSGANPPSQILSKLGSIKLNESIVTCARVQYGESILFDRCLLL